MKKVLAAWSSEVYEKGATKMVSLRWFNDDRGYSKENRETIKKKKIGEAVTLSEGHTIVRTK